MTDEPTLMLMLRDGDEDALAELYARLGGHVHALAWWLLNDREEAHEVLQDTFDRLFRRAHQYRPELGSPRAFIYTVARNEALSRLRARGARPVLDGDEDLLGELSTPSASPDLDTRMMVQGALVHLSAHDQTLIHDSFFLGLSHGEIASAHALPLGTVKTRVRRALARMRRTLEGS
ncbi:sigma-70 family RNA polymerase sigma factor [Deinococcus psychrotolerans]|uniref:Sigma-70 family RNA polymerase sigma factor n=1 Tax=Deinococcus psychrotolerans TaxID=2489213 RepID=A0A3G8YLF4_9DEIO|nr:sigma-70 family RNA polymerase sigma factor [Deinococcus psychrotolerans]AZI41936.1 sigma-70 family RNA polymerase sigma factor [Deinococcus psychrotolerans]